MSMRLYAKREINRPAPEVAAFFFDAANNSKWQEGMRRCEWETDEPIRVGSRYRQEASFLGRPVVARFEVIEYTPARSITIDTIEGTFPITVTRTVEALDDQRSVVTAEIEGGPGGLMRLLAPITRWIAQRSVDADYNRLVDLLG